MAVSEAYIGLGSNLGEPVAQVNAGAAALELIPETRVRACSSLYRSAAVGVVEQADFVNAVCLLETVLTPQGLLAALQQIEARRGRIRPGQAGGPRVLDLDLLMYGQVRMRSSRLILPHPRLHERAFVLYPLAEIAPGLVVPDQGSIEALMAGCEDQEIEKLPETLSWKLCQ